MISTLSKYSNSFLTVLMLVIFSGMLIIASRYPAGARFMPYVLGIPAVLLCLLQLFLDARERHRKNQVEERSEVEKAEEQVSRAVGHAVHFDVGDLLAPEASLDPRERIRREAIAWAYFLAFIAGIVIFGFHIAVPVFLITFLRFRANASWIMTLGLTAVACFVLFFAFETLLHIELHKGFITEHILDSISG
jgi:hypothetical protein